MAGRLEGKVALITGTGTGQGQAAAVLFAKEGAKVVGCDLNVEGAKQTVVMAKDAGGEMVSMQPVDLGDGKQAKKWIDFAVKTYGCIDILYNNAGATKVAAIDQMTEEDWHFAIRNELDLIYFACHYAWPYLKTSGNGVIINTGSIACMVGSPRIAGQPRGLLFAHCAAKGGISALTRELALQGASVGIRVINLCPGIIEMEGRSREAELELIPLHRIGKPLDVAKVAVFLASDDAAYVTGVDIVVDGGYTAQ